ncbi:MAG: hypothetical protein ABL921_32375 [Pirellula sp.]
MRSQQIYTRSFGMRAAYILTLASILLGCKGSQLGAHRWGGGPTGQGTVETQKARAVYFDPYPMNDIGPEVVGGRPRGFTNPLAEAHRNELKMPLTMQNPWAGYGR